MIFPQGDKSDAIDVMDNSQTSNEGAKSKRKSKTPKKVKKKRITDDNKKVKTMRVL